MDLTPHVASLRDDLAAAAAVGDEATTRAGTTLAAALEPAMRLALMNALSDLAAEVSENLDDHSVTLRLRGREVDVVVTHDAPSAEAPHHHAGFSAGPSASSVGFGPASSFAGRMGAAGGPDVGDISRMTLRLVDQIKGQAEQAAAAQGMSLNSWVSQAVQGALSDNLRRKHRGWDPGAGSGPSGRRDTGDDEGDDGGVKGWVRG